MNERERERESHVMSLMSYAGAEGLTQQKLIVVELTSTSEEESGLSKQGKHALGE